MKKKQNHSGELCFVIMPFGGWFDNYYTDIYCPTIIKTGLTPKRADDLFRPSNIVQDIWELTKRAKIILADLTSKNANVFYELGLAHALAKPAILVTETIEDIPFDLRSLRVIQYSKNEPSWGTVLQKNIENAIKETLASPNETVPTAFLETKRSEADLPQVTKHERDLLELKQELELIKRQISGASNDTLPLKGTNTYNKIKTMIAAGYSKSEITHHVVSLLGISERAAGALVRTIAERSGSDPFD